jgi:hypothetical protein
MAKSHKILIFTGLAILVFGLANFVLADLQNPLGNNTSFSVLITNIAKIVAQIGLPVAAIAILYAGFLFATARGNEDQIKRAKGAFFWAIIGAALLLGAWALTSAIQQFINSLK